MKKILEFTRDYILPFFTVGLTIYTLIKEKNQRKIKNRIADLELYIKEHEVSKIKSKINHDTEPKIVCNIMSVGRNKYTIKFANLGESKAYNINASIPEHYEVHLLGILLPYEYLEPRASFEERVGIYLNSKPKFKIDINWENEKGEKFSSNQLLSI